MQSNEHERRRLARLALLKVMDTEPEPVFDALVRIAAAVCGKPIALISLVDERRQWFKANLGFEGVHETPRNAAFCAHTIERDGLMEVPDAASDTRFSDNPLVVGAPGIRFYAGVPLVMPSGERMGSLCVMGSEAGRLDSGQAATLHDLAEVVQWALLRREQLHHLLAIGDESRFQAVSYAAPMGIFQADETGAVFHVSGRWEHVVGTDLQRAMGSGWMDSVHRGDRHAVELAWNNAVAQADPFDMEFRVCGARGDWRTHVRAQARPALWGEPPRHGYVGVVGDVTDRKEVESQLRSANKFLERAERLSGVGGWEADLKTKKVTWTEQNCRIYDLPPGYQPAFDEHLRHFDGDARRQMAETVQNALQTGEPWDLQLPMVTAAGRPVWVRSVGVAEFEHGKPRRLVGALQDVTTQKSAQDQLRAANALLMSVIDSLPCGLSVFDGDLRLIAHNQQFRSLQDFPDELFRDAQVSFESLIRHNALRGEYGSGPPEEAVRQIVERARAPQAHHLQRVRSNGITLDIRGAPLPGGGFVTTYVDVSAAKTAEQALRDSEERLKRAMDASRLTLWEIDFGSGKAYLSANWSALMGGPAQEVVTTVAGLLERVPAADRSRIKAAMMAIANGTAQRYEEEHQVRRDDGSMIWIHSQGTVVLRDAQGRAVRATGTNQDITRRKAAQEQLARAAAITSATLESTADGIVVVSAEREIVLYNRQFLSIWNLSETPGNAPRATWLAHLLSQMKEPQAYLDRVEALYDQPTLESFELLELLDGRVVERYSRPMFVDGAPQGRVWNFRDVTAKQQADVELMRAKEQAEAASLAKSDFLSTVSHEIRTPLNGVLGMTRLLLDAALGPQERRYVELANSSAQSLLGLINDLLDLGKIEAGRMEFEHADFSLVDLLSELREIYGLRAREKGLAFTGSVAAEVPDRVIGDAGRLRQILNNLLTNALKFTRSGSIGLDVQVASPGPGRPTIAFTIEDTGIGIAADVQLRLFQRFSQADSSTTRDFGGTGLGLAIVKQLCEEMGGRVALDSEPGRGAVFRCELPFLPAPAGALSAPGSEPALAVQRAPRLHRILVAEDNTTNQIVVAGMLHRAGYMNVTMVGDGQQALDAVARGNFDVLLMDCRMPIMDGYESTNRLRAAGCTIPIIALTANASEPERQRCIALGMNDFLTKPLDPSSLEQALDHWTSGRPGDQAAVVPAALARPQLAFARQIALDRMSGDQQLLDLVLGSFRSQAPLVTQLLRGALGAGDAQEVHRQLHTLCGSAAMVGAEKLWKLGGALEEISAAGMLLQIEQSLPELAAAIEEFMVASRPAGTRQTGPDGPQGS